MLHKNFSRNLLHVQVCQVFDPNLRLNEICSLVGLVFNGPVNTVKVMLSMSVYLTTLVLGRFSPLSSQPVLVHILCSQKLTTVLLESVEGRE